MAPITSKRFRENTLEVPKKRQRVEAVPRTNSKPTTNALDSLRWKQVTLPDLLEDAEGFFGLEEIEDVDVVMDTQSGKVEFRSILDKPSEASAESQAQIKHTGNSVGKGEDEWDGFEDSATSESKASISSQAAKGLSPRDPPRELGKSKKAKQKVQGAVKIGGDKDPRKSAFEALNTEVTEEADVSAWNSLGLSSHTTSSLARLGFSKPTPIQSTAIPEILNGHDVIGKASTGSGKTLAFGIPILEHYLDTHKGGLFRSKANGLKPPAALILSPTRELAHQLSAHLTDLCPHDGLESPRIVTLTGGLSMHKQQRLLHDADIIIGTPGRLWEVISGSTGLIKSLKQIRYLVVDEADRLLSEGHFKEVEEILNALDREIEGEDGERSDAEDTEKPKAKRQTLVFSATFQRDLQRKLAGKGKPFGSDLMNKQESMEYLLKKLNFRDDKPKFIDVDPVSQMARGLKEGIVECTGLEKDLYLYALLLHNPSSRTLVFTNSIPSVRRLTSLLQTLSVPAHALHSQMPQKARLRSVERFSSPTDPGSILIATDVAARGLDIPSIQLVLHYHVPRAADMYVHRSGRTARAEKSGSSILLCAPEEVQGVRRLVAKTHARQATTDSKEFFLRSIELDRRVVSRLKARVTLAKRISDSLLAKEKKGSEDSWLKSAAEDLGVDYDSEEFAQNEKKGKGRGAGRKKAEKEARGLTKAEVGALRAELREMLGKRVNVGVSERYLTAGGVDVDDLLEGSKGDFLGRVEGAVEMF